MKKFMAVFTGLQASPGRARWEALDEVTRREREKAGMEAWMKWGEVHADAVVDHGGPLGKTSRVSTDGVADTSNAMTGYVMVQADSREAAARMFENHPHFAIFPGDAVEIMEVLPVPGM